MRVQLDMLSRRFWSAPAEEAFTEEEGEEERPEVGDLVTLLPDNKQMGILKALEGTRAEALGHRGCDFKHASVIHRLHDVSAHLKKSGKTLSHGVALLSYPILVL